MQHQIQPSYVEQALFQASDIKLIEQNASQSGGYAMYELMEKAGLASWLYLKKHWPEAKNITVLCGKGNNAGDGFVLARLGASEGKAVQVLCVDIEAEYKGDALTAYQAMLKQNINPKIFAPSLLEGQDLIVDALLGTGLSGKLRTNFKAIIDALNTYIKNSNTETPVFCIDIPSGLDSDTGTMNPVAIQASRTLTFIAVKSGMVTGHARACCGIIDLDALGIKSIDTKQFLPSAWINDAELLINSLPKRSKVAHKGDHGHLLLIGGDYGFGGAILMSAIAAARCGVGMFTILTRDAHVAPILTQCPEAMIRSISGADDPALIEMLGNVDAVVIGPGLGKEEWGKGILEVIWSSELPMLIDADALNILAEHEKRNAHWVMTPHPGEASRLLGIDTSDVEQNRYQAVMALQSKYDGIAVLKGAGTLITDDHQQTTVCSEGNAGMASAGMGDILSGIIGSLLAQGVENGLAARTGVALHARAGDLAAMNGQKGLMATDLLIPLRMLVNS
ncbi:MAG: NAD(P)H-hydrate dehydratase [Gammaproteobacteria bacterium]|nr:NAD(P)H-hydrate dehydratase [Gammaproteobacteria bacterium]